MSYTFETLYGIGIKNKIKEWNIKVIDKGKFSTILYSYGYLNKTKVECSRNIYITDSKGYDKNKKCTSHYQLAILYAQQKWKDKIENGYNIDIEVAKIKINKETPPKKETVPRVTSKMPKKETAPKKETVPRVTSKVPKKETAPKKETVPCRTGGFDIGEVPPHVISKVPKKETAPHVTSKVPKKV